MTCFFWLRISSNYLIKKGQLFEQLLHLYLLLRASVGDRGRGERDDGRRTGERKVRKEGER